MATQIEIFKQACQMAALKDDNKVSKDEARTLKAIDAAATRFSKDLFKIIADM